MSKIDPYYYPFDRIGFPEKYIYVPQPENFGVYLLCNTKDRRKIFVYKDRKKFGLNSKRDDDDVIRLFVSLADKLKECELANDLFHLSDLHPIHYTKIGAQKIAVYRIRKNDLRLCLIQLAEHLILFRLCTKREDVISKSEGNIIDKRVKAIFKYPPHQHTERLSS